MLGGTVIPVKLEKEPLNPVDTKAIAFVTNVNGTWERIGYVVQEILDPKAMDDNLILNVQYECQIHASLQTSRMVCRDQNNKKWRLVANSYSLSQHFNLICIVNYNMNARR